VAALQGQQPIPALVPMEGRDRAGVTPDSGESEVRQTLGDGVWGCLATPTQTHLCQAWQAHPGEGAAADYAKSAQALARAVVGEILQPLTAGTAPL
jgi:hypothetical protein